MSIEYAIAGGYLEIDKNVFTKEMLCQVSRLRKLLNSNDLSKKINIIKDESGNFYTIDFTHSAEVKLEETYSMLFQSLIEDYPGKIKGKVTIRVNTEYSTFFTEYSIG